MHTTAAPSGLRYHHNGDFSGSVAFAVPVGVHDPKDLGVREIDSATQTALVELPFEDMKHLVFAYLRSKWISLLEQADDETLERLIIPFLDTND